MDVSFSYALLTFLRLLVGRKGSRGFVLQGWEQDCGDENRPIIDRSRSHLPRKWITAPRPYSGEGGKRNRWKRDFRRRFDLALWFEPLKKYIASIIVTVWEAN